MEIVEFLCYLLALVCFLASASGRWTTPPDGRYRWDLVPLGLGLWIFPLLVHAAQGLG